MAYFRSEIKGLIYSETLLHDHRRIKKATASSPTLKSSQNSSTEKLKKLILNSGLQRTDISERRHLNFRKWHPRCKNYHGSETSPRHVQLSTPVLPDSILRPMQIGRAYSSNEGRSGIKLASSFSPLIPKWPSVDLLQIVYNLRWPLAVRNSDAWFVVTLKMHQSTIFQTENETSTQLLPRLEP